MFSDNQNFFGISGVYIKNDRSNLDFAEIDDVGYQLSEKIKNFNYSEIIATDDDMYNKKGEKIIKFFIGG